MALRCRLVPKTVTSLAPWRFTVAEVANRSSARIIRLSRIMAATRSRLIILHPIGSLKHIASAARTKEAVKSFGHTMSSNGGIHHVRFPSDICTVLHLPCIKLLRSIVRTLIPTPSKLAMTIPSFPYTPPQSTRPTENSNRIDSANYRRCGPLDSNPGGA